MNLEPLQHRLYPAHLTVPIEYHDFWTANFAVAQTQAAIDQYVPEYTEDLFTAVKRYVLHGNCAIFLEPGNLEILSNKVRAEFDLMYHSKKPTNEMVYQVLMFMIEKR